MIRFAIAGLSGAAILGTALASGSGAIALDTAEALIALLPAFALATLATIRCGRGQGAGA